MTRALAIIENMVVLDCIGVTCTPVEVKRYKVLRESWGEQVGESYCGSVMVLHSVRWSLIHLGP